MAEPEEKSEVCRRYLDEDLKVVAVKDLGRAKKALEVLRSERRKIAEQISTAGREGTSTVLDTALREAGKCVDEIGKLSSEQDELSRQVVDCAESAAWVHDKVTPLLKKARPLESCRHYLQWVACLQAMSSAISSHHSAARRASAVDVFYDLLMLEKSALAALPQAKNLHGCFQQHTDKWRETLEGTLVKDFDENVVSFNWPFVGGKVPLATIPPESLATFRQNASLLLKLRPYSSSGVSDSAAVPYPLELMMRPLQKRFRYHFHGKRQTNDIKRPEWYLTQIRSWIAGHTPFLVTIIQPVLDEYCSCKVAVERLFVRSLIALVVVKLRKDTPCLLADPPLLSHTINEMLSFSSDLSAMSPTTATERLALLKVLEEDRLLNAWVAVEETLMLNHVDKALASPSAWQPHYQEVVDTDETLVPECVLSIMAYIHAVTERYKNLLALHARLMFCRLQLQAMDRFAAVITRLMQAELGDCTGLMFASLLCAVQYVLDVLSEWAEQPFFISLEERLQEEREEAEQTASPSSSLSLPVTAFLAAQLSSLSPSASSDETRSLFSTCITQLNSIKQKMLESMVDAILADFRLASKSLLQQKWVSFPSQHDIVAAEVSDATCDLLTSLRHHLRLAEKRLPSNLFNPVWINLAKQLDVFIFEKIILSISVNEGGAAQLKFDLMRNLVPLFNHCTARPERYFPLVREACSLLTLLPGSAILLREELQAAAKENTSMAKLDGSATQSVAMALLRTDIKNITPQQALTTLNRRIDWPQT